VASLGAVTDWVRFLRAMVTRMRAAPGPGLIGRLSAASGDELDDVELAGLVDGMIVGGLETTASMLALGAVVLVQDEQVSASLRRGQPPRPYVDELLRHLSVVQVAFPRFARTDTLVGETSVRAGDVVVCSLLAANRDARRGDGLDLVDPAPSSAHLAFGHGLHRCVGAELARLELETALPALVQRFPHLRLAVATEDLVFRARSVVFGVQEELPVLLGKPGPTLAADPPALDHRIGCEHRATVVPLGGGPDELEARGGHEDPRRRL